MNRVLVNSKIKWLGCIPDDWNIVKLKYLASITTGKKDAIAENPEGKYEFFTCSMENKKTDEYTFDTEALLVCGNGVVGYTRYYKGKFDAYQRTYVIKDFHADVHPNYLKHYFNGLLENRLEANKIGSVIDFIKVGDLLNFPICLPCVQEQIKIADFLDKKCNKIDSLIYNNEKEIALIEEYRKSYITQVITNGLHPDVPFKDSGISWIGRIPDHWVVISLKRLGTARNGLSYHPGDIADKGTLVLRSSNIQNNKISFKDNVFVTKKIPKDLILNENDLLICSRNGSRSLVGKNILIDQESAGSTFGAFMCVYRSKYNKFIRYCLNSNIFDYYLATFLTSTINQLTTSNLNSIKIPFTYDEKEQQEIVDHLDKMEIYFEKMIDYREQIIERLKEYKKSLIYEVTTGKIEV